MAASSCPFQCVIRHCHIFIYDIIQLKNLELSLQWRHNGRDSLSNHQPHDCLLNRLYRRRSKKTSKLRVTGLCAGNSPLTGEFPAQMASNAEKVSIWWRHHLFVLSCGLIPVDIILSCRVSLVALAQSSHDSMIAPIEVEATLKDSNHRHPSITHWSRMTHTCVSET